MSIQVKDYTTSALVDVTSGGYLNVNTPTSPGAAGEITFCAEVDSGVISGTRDVREAEINTQSRLRTTVPNVLFYESFNGGTLNGVQWANATSTMAIAQANGFLTINSGAAVANGNYATVYTYKSFPILGTQSLVVGFKALVNNSLANNVVCDVGVGNMATTAIPLDGVFFRWAHGGKLQGVLNQAGVETATSEFSVPLDGTVNYYEITVTWDAVEFRINDVLMERLAAPNGDPGPMRTAAAPFYARVFNTSVASRPFSIGLAGVSIVTNGRTFGDDWGTKLSGFGQNANYGQTSWGNLTTQSNWSNTPTINAGVLYNTIAPTGGYTSITLGGQFAFASLVGGSADYILFAYQPSAGAAAVNPHNLYITDIGVDMVNLGASAGATPSIFNICLGYGSTNVSLVTTDSSASRGPRRFPLGMISFSPSANIGQFGGSIRTSLVTPIMVEPGTFLHVIAQEIEGTNTASETYRGVVSLNGYWE